MNAQEEHTHMAAASACPPRLPVAQTADPVLWRGDGAYRIRMTMAAVSAAAAAGHDRWEITAGTRVVRRSHPAITSRRPAPSRRRGERGLP